MTPKLYRLSTVKAADKILVMDRGQIVEVRTIYLDHPKKLQFLWVGLGSLCSHFLASKKNSY